VTLFLDGKLGETFGKIAFFESAGLDVQDSVVVELALRNAGK